MKRKSKGEGLPLFVRRESIKEGEPLASDASAAPDPKGLALDVALALKGLPSAAITESAFRRKFGDLYHRIWSSYGGLVPGLLELICRSVGDRPGRNDVLDALRVWYRRGEPVTIEGLILTQPSMAVAVVEQFGSMDAALTEAGLDPVLAGTDRCWTSERLFEFVFGWLRRTDVSLPLAEGSILEPVFVAAWTLRYGTWSRFMKEFGGWLDGQPGLSVLFGRNQLGRVRLYELSVTGRGTKGASLAGAGKVAGLSRVSGVRGHAVVTTLGRLLPLDPSGVAHLGFGSGPEADGRFPLLKRNEKVVTVLDLSVADGLMVVVTRQGRVKAMPRAEFKRLPGVGTSVIRLTQTDRVACVRLLPPGCEAWAVVSSGGRAIGLDLSSVRLTGRGTMGVFRGKPGEDTRDLPVDIVPLSAGTDLVMLGRNAKVCRVASAEVPIRKSPSKGRRLWRTPVVAACAVAAGEVLCVASRHGRLTCFEEQLVPVRHPGGVGVRGIRLDGDDTVEAICSFTLADVEDR